jgi:hypothetical protein
MFAFQPLVQLINALICFGCAHRLRKSLPTSSSPLTRFFFRFYLFFGLFFFFLSVPALVSGFQPLVMGIGYVIAHLSLYLGLAYFILIPVSLYVSWDRRFAFGIVLGLGILVVFYHVLNFNLPIFDGIIIRWNLDRGVGIIQGLLSSLIGIIGGMFFLAGRLKTPSQALQRRAQYLGWGILTIVLAGIVLYFAAIQGREQILFWLIFGDLLEIMGILLMFRGIRSLPKPTALPPGSEVNHKIR